MKRSPLARSASPLPVAQGDDHLSKIVHELVQSETAYVRDLEILLQLYVEPLRRSRDGATSPRATRSLDEDDVSDLLSPQEVNVIFSNIDQVLGVNKALLQALEKDPSLANLTAALRQMAEYLKVYSIYCANQDSSLKMLEDVEKRMPVRWAEKESWRISHAFFDR